MCLARGSFRAGSSSPGIHEGLPAASESVTMDASSHDKQPSEARECVVNNSGNASFILGTGKSVTPQKRVEDATPNLCTPVTVKSPLNFSTITVEQLGITPESFVKTPSGKSASLQKTRRRSTVGVRGSPETNCLIRFIAQQRSLKNAARSLLTQNSPFQGSPGLYRHASALKERMAAFRSAFHSVQETEKMAGGPAASKADGESKTSNLTKKEGLVEYQQSGFPLNSSSKRRRISSQNSPDDHLSSAKGKVVCGQMLADQSCAIGTSADLAESSDIGPAQPGCLVAPCPELMETSHGLGVADCVEDTQSVVAVPLDTPEAQVNADTAPAIRSSPVFGSSTPSKTFVLRSVLKKPGKLFAENGKECILYDSGSHLIPDPSNCKEQRAGRENCKTPGFLNLKKRKRVTFGEDLSPEVFDESLPANTPLCKGGTPVRQRNLNAASPLQSPVHEQLLQPNFDDSEENLENIEPTQIPIAILSPSKSSFSETLPGIDTCSSLGNLEQISYNVGRPTRISHRRKQVMSSAGGVVCNSYTTEAEPCKEKNMNRRTSQEKKCISNALPGKKQVLKSYRKKKRRGKKSVEKSLYGERDMASKKPLLSPIPELPEVSEMTPLADCTQKICSDDFNVSDKQEEVISLEIPAKRKRLLTQEEDLPEFDPAFDQSLVSELCCCVLPVTAASVGGPNANAGDTGRAGNSSTKIKHQSANEPKTETKTENSPMPCASVTREHVVSDNPKPLCIPWCQEFSETDKENPCEVLTVSENMNMKCEEESACPAPKGNLQCDPVTSDSDRGGNCSEDVLVENLKETTSHSETVGRKCSENGSLMSGRERKRRRLSMLCCEGQSSYLEQKGDSTSSNSGGSSVEISLRNPQLCEDLSDAIEQSFQRTNTKLKVRRSTRLQGNLDSTGLIWILPPTPPTSQKTKRRMTICAFDSRRLQSMSSREDTVSSGQTPNPLPSIPGSGCQGIGSSKLPGKRRKSCVYTLPNAESTTEPPHFKRIPSLKKGESSQLQ
ncbi:cell division cycle-associated protein 2 isoform X2 [Cricetulus griseus]|uniref:Cell division cycle-associated protein 2 isoform X2 n=1 Tax=Cricetulus griseus TaxID=10029 RepID=A0A9J7F2H4_CRIGR|nr:cell division cycle-associated protein 2 isoform X2 [Cricetulus griseus]XP_027296022.1 cell division cycle-associated protein 2 isoform X2 [Cricetulus griseus]